MADIPEMPVIQALAPIVKRERGRPSTYDPSYCDMVLDFGRMGMSKAEMANALDCTRATMDSWGQEHPDFLNALSKAREYSLAWWEDKARTGLHMGSAFNSSLYAKAMSGRFPAEPYRDRVEHSGPNGAPLGVTVQFVRADSPKVIEGPVGQAEE